eukprot:4230421-Amphidinium_carterae.1
MQGIPPRSLCVDEQGPQFSLVRSTSTSRGKHLSEIPAVVRGGLSGGMVRAFGKSYLPSLACALGGFVDSLLDSLERLLPSGRAGVQQLTPHVVARPARDCSMCHP